MQWGFSSNVTSDMVALTNFIMLFNFCGRLYSLQSSWQTLSDQYSKSSSNYQSNEWQQVQYNTD